MQVFMSVIKSSIALSLVKITGAKKHVFPESNLDYMRFQDYLLFYFSF